MQQLTKDHPYLDVNNWKTGPQHSAAVAVDVRARLAIGLAEHLATNVDSSDIQTNSLASLRDLATRHAQYAFTVADRLTVLCEKEGSIVSVKHLIEKEASKPSERRSPCENFASVLRRLRQSFTPWRI